MNIKEIRDMSSEELKKTLEAGGMPMPSIAILKAETGHSKYGPVSLVFDKSVIDTKANKKNKI